LIQCNMIIISNVNYYLKGRKLLNNEIEIIYITYFINIIL